MIAFFLIWLAISFALIFLGIDQTFTDENGEEIFIVPFIIFLPMFWLYYIISEYLFQRTLGKLVTKTKVINKQGEQPSFNQILGRSLSRSIPFEYLSYLFTPVGIHDYLSGTRVIEIGE